MNSLTRLLSGEFENLGDLTDVITQLSGTVDDFSTRCFEFLRQERGRDISTFGAYCGRTLLESACILLIGRINPYRLLLLKRYQEQPAYELGKRHSISVEWKGDILPKTVVREEQLWDKVNDKELTSPLLSDYMWDIYWVPAFRSLVDNMEQEDSEILTNLKSIPIEGIRHSLRAEAETLYSSLSKGIHQEFVVPLSIVYDETMIKNLLERTIFLISKLSLLSHYIPTVIGSIDKDTAFHYIVDIENCIRA